MGWGEYSLISTLRETEKDVAGEGERANEDKKGRTGERDSGTEFCTQRLLEKDLLRKISSGSNDNMARILSPSMA
jgi:hypothetical protein